MRVGVAVSLVMTAVMLLGHPPITDGKTFTMLAMMGLHQFNGSSPDECGEINHVTGVVFYEALKYVISNINKEQHNLLFNNTLAIDVFDTCKSTKRLKNSLSSKILSMWTKPSLGALGPLTSDEAILASPVLGVFDMPMISYYANGIDLVDRGKYGNFFRTVPSASLQVAAMLDIVGYFKWTYISVVNSNGNEGQRAMDEFYNGLYVLRGYSHCISKRSTIPATPTEDDYDQAVKNLYSDKKARVIALVTTPEDTRNLFLAVKRLGIPPGWFTWLSGTSWDTDTHHIEGVEDIAKGALIMAYSTGVIDKFWSYFLSRTPHNNKDYFFLKYWADVFDCEFYPSPGKRDCNSSSFSLMSKQHLHQHVPVKIVMEAVYKYACAFRKVMEATCPIEATRSACLQREIYSKFLSLDLWRQMQTVLEMGGQVCAGLGYIDFNKYGGVSAKFSILNLKLKPDKSVLFDVVGDWTELRNNNRTFNIYPEKIIWANGSSTENTVPVSLCSSSCQPGYYQKTLLTVHNPQCCWQCVKCADNELVLAHGCQACPLTHRPDAARKNCTLLPIKYASIDGVLPAINIALTVLGLVATTFVLIVFAMYHTSRIVKATSRELSIIILVGIYIGFASPFAYLSRPSPVICGIQRLISGLALSLCFAPLFLRLNRIYRIFQSARTQITRPPMVSPVSQVLISFCIVFLQMLLGLVWIVANTPHVVTTHPSGANHVIESCDTSEISIMMNLMVSLALIVMCTWYAFKTRKFPKNFNESQSIGVTMYITCLLWAVFVTMFMFTSDKDDDFMRSFLTCLFATISSFVLLIGLFGPKIYVLLVPSMQVKDHDGTYTSYPTKSEENITTVVSKEEKEFNVYRVSNNGIDVSTTTADLMASWWKK